MRNRISFLFLLCLALLLVCGRANADPQSDADWAIEDAEANLGLARAELAKASKARGWYSDLYTLIQAKDADAKAKMGPNSADYNAFKGYMDTAKTKLDDSLINVNLGSVTLAGAVTDVVAANDAYGVSNWAMALSKAIVSNNQSSVVYTLSVEVYQDQLSGNQLLEAAKLLQKYGLDPASGSNGD